MSYHTLELQEREFDRYLTLSEKAARQETIEADDAFVAAMSRAIKRGREVIKPGIITDGRPLMPAMIHGYAPAASCGSPAALCTEQGE